MMRKMHFGKYGMVRVDVKWKTGEIEAFEEVTCQFYVEEDAFWEV